MVDRVHVVGLRIDPAGDALDGQCQAGAIKLVKVVDGVIDIRLEPIFAQALLVGNPQLQLFIE